MFTLLLFTCLLSGWAVGAADPKDGLGCKTEADFTYCEGKSPDYTKLAGEVEKGSSGGGLDTRSKDNNDLMTRSYGMSGSACDQGYGGACQALNSAIWPTLLYNSRNQARYILQLGAFKQPVQLNICTGKVCGHYGFCEQNFINVQLLSWDPFDHYPALLVDHFRIPSCCKCKRGGSGGPGSWKWD